MKNSEAIRILGDIKLCSPLGQAAFVGIEAIKNLQKYQEIGTVEECRDARERQRAKKPEFELNLSDYTSRFICECGKRIIVKHDSGVMNNNDAPNYCSNCGRKFDWSDTD